MTKSFRNMRRSAGCALVAAAMQACGCETGVDCNDGLTVTLSALPPAPFQVELLVGGQVQRAPAGATCSVGASDLCQRSIQFDTRARDGVSVRVTTSTGVRTTDLPRITYQSPAGNGDCGLCFGQAEVGVSVP